MKLNELNVGDKFIFYQYDGIREISFKSDFVLQHRLVGHDVETSTTIHKATHIDVNLIERYKDGAN